MNGYNIEEENNKKNAQYRKDFIQLAITLDNEYAIELFAKQVGTEDNELLEYLIKKNDMESSEKILSMLANEFGKCQKPASGLQDYDYLSYDKNYEYKYQGMFEDEKKRNAFKNYNTKLNKILGLAISAHNQYLSKKLLTLYTETVNVIEGDGDIDKGKIRYKGVKIDRAHIYVDFNNEEKNEAQRRYNEAVKSGVFNH